MVGGRHRRGLTRSTENFNDFNDDEIYRLLRAARLPWVPRTWGSGASAGNRIRNSVPSRGSLATSISPSWSATISRATTRPSPLPCPGAFLPSPWQATPWWFVVSTGRMRFFNFHQIRDTATKSPILMAYPARKSGRGCDCERQTRARCCARSPAEPEDVWLLRSISRSVSMLVVVFAGRFCRAPLNAVVPIAA